jgi:nucleoside-diphosphate-sugar epimerase
MEATNLITSPFGIGKQLIVELLKKQESVFTIFPSPKEVPMSFLGKINLKYGFVQFDREINFGKILPKRVKNVYHLYDVYNGSYTKMFKSNPCASLLLLEWAKKVGVKKFIYLSSGEVYGQGKNLDEESSYNPRSFYATTKFEAEILLKYYYKSFEISTLRLFFPFGKDLNQGYIYNLYKSIKSGDNIDTRYSVISPTFIDDVVAPLIKVRSVKDSQVFNICGSPSKVEDLVDAIKYICAGSPKKIVAGKVELSGSNVKAQRVLGYHETPFNEALKMSFGK